MLSGFIFVISARQLSGLRATSLVRPPSCTVPLFCLIPSQYKSFPAIQLRRACQPHRHHNSARRQEEVARLEIESLLLAVLFGLDRVSALAKHEVNHVHLTAVQLWTAGGADNRGMDLELPRLMLWHNFCPARAQSRIRHLCKKAGKVTLGVCKLLVMAGGP